jgi:hypothetical protein
VIIDIHYPQFLYVGEKMSNGVQSFLSLGALMIFSLISLRFDTAVLQNVEVEVENKVYLTAFSLADDLLEEIKQKAFDEKTVDFKAITTTALTPSSNLGKESGEVWPNFNDIDDYQNYSKPVSLPHAENYTIKSYVSYVQANNQDLQSIAQTYYKRVEIFVDSPYLKHQIKLAYVFTLHSK